MLSFIKLFAGFALLVWGADRFVDGACAAARRLGIPSVIVGLTIVALGTSAPELSVSVTAALKGANEIAVGNVVGSNLFNLLVVVGVSAAISPMQAEPSLIRRDLPLSGLAAATLFALLAVGGGRLGRGCGIALLLAMAAYLFLLVHEALQRHTKADPAELTSPVWAIPLNLGLGLACIVWGGDLTVEGASGIARMFGLSEALIGLTIVAVGTSLPELVTSVTAAVKGESGLALGNAVGSNLCNILLILGASSAICPIQVSMDALINVGFLTVSTLACIVMLWKPCRVGRVQGIVMAASYLCYMAWLIA